MKLSIVIPCYNEQEVILETQSRLVFLLNEFLNKKIISDYEILYIDDGSQDQTFQHLEGIAAEDQHAKVIALSNNFGHQAALTAGLLHASGDAVVSMDADCRILLKS
ncbi:MAG: glycosyltransferase [Planctomycetota bacterium]|jgi:dolichol-phosphate mannosyltransferase